MQKPIYMDMKFFQSSGKWDPEEVHQGCQKIIEDTQGGLVQKIFCPMEDYRHWKIQTHVKNLHLQLEIYVCIYTRMSPFMSTCKWGFWWGCQGQEMIIEKTKRVTRYTDMTQHSLIVSDKFVHGICRQQWRMAKWHVRMQEDYWYVGRVATEVHWD